MIGGQLRGEHDGRVARDRTERPAARGEDQHGGGGQAQQARAAAGRGSTGGARQIGQPHPKTGRGIHRREPGAMAGHGGSHGAFGGDLLLAGRAAPHVLLHVGVFRGVGLPVGVRGQATLEVSAAGHANDVSHDQARPVASAGAAAAAVSASNNCRRPREIRDITVPTGTPTMAAISP